MRLILMVLGIFSITLSSNCSRPESPPLADSAAALTSSAAPPSLPMPGAATMPGLASADHGLQTEESSPMPANSSAQLSRGAHLYADKCVKCHGARGEGSADGPALVGPTALPMDPRPGSHRLHPFTSAANVARYIEMKMPPKEAGKLSEEDALALAAYTVYENGIQLPAGSLTTEAAKGVLLDRLLDAGAFSGNRK